MGIVQVLRGEHQKVYSILGILLAGSVLFWPLLNSILTIAVFVYWLVFDKKHFDIRSQKSQWVLLFISLYILVIAGYFYSSNVEEAQFKLQQKLPLLIFPVIFGVGVGLETLTANRILRSFVLFTFVGGLICLLFGLVGYLQTGVVSGLRGYDVVILKGMSPFMMGLCCLLSAALVLDRLIRKEETGRLNPALSWVMVAFFSMFLFLLGNRNMLFSWSILVVYYFFRFVRTLKFRLVFLVSLILMFAAAIVFNPSLNKQWHDLIDFSENNTVPLDADKSLGRGWGGKAVRVAVWKCSWDVIAHNFVVGVGSGDVQDELQKAYANRQFYFASDYNRYNAHNEYIQQTIGFGIFGLLFFCACLFVPFFAFVRDGRYRVYCFFLLAIAVICVTESILELNKGIVFYSFFNSIFAFTKLKNHLHATS